VGGRAVAQGAGVEVGPVSTLVRLLFTAGVANPASFEEMPGIAVGSAGRSPKRGAQPALRIANTANTFKSHCPIIALEISDMFVQSEIRNLKSALSTSTLAPDCSPGR
jgi:hypothetical protein